MGNRSDAYLRSTGGADAQEPKIRESARGKILGTRHSRSARGAEPAQRPLCAHWLSEIDLSTTPLAEIINPFEICGRRFIILSVVGLDYTVKISSGFGTAGDGGQFVFTRDGEAFMLKDELSYWIN